MSASRLYPRLYPESLVVAGSILFSQQDVCRHLKVITQHPVSPLIYSAAPSLGEFLTLPKSILPQFQDGAQDSRQSELPKAQLFRNGHLLVLGDFH